MRMRRMIASLLVVIMICSVFLVSSCNRKESEETTLPADEIDTLTRNYNSTSIRFDIDFFSPLVSEVSDGQYLLVPDFSSEQNILTCALFDKDGVIKEFDVDYDSISCATAIDDTKFVACAFRFDPYEAVLGFFDYEGNLLQEASAEVLSGATAQDFFVYEDEGGNIRILVASGEGVYVLDENLERVGKIDTPIAQFFEEDGKVYGFDFLSIYELDLETMTTLSCGFFDDATEDVLSFGNGTLDASCITDRSARRVYEVNPETMSLDALVNLDYVLESPPTVDFGGAMLNFNKIDDETFYIPYSSDGYSPFGSVSELVFIYPDDTLNLSEREQIKIQGIHIAWDPLLRSVMYEYNKTQSDYLVVIEEIASDVDFSVPEEANQAYLDILTDYQNGNTPDIFYGDGFDYQYWGENGMVLDMAPYLLESEYFDLEELSPNVINIFFGENIVDTSSINTAMSSAPTADENNYVVSEADVAGLPIYQVFGGYGLLGYWGRSSQFDSSEVSLYDMPQLYGDQQLFSSTERSTNICYNALSYNLGELYHNDALTLENITMVVRLALDEGLSYDELWALIEANGYADIEEVNEIAIESNIYMNRIADYYSLNCSFGELPVYIGYPSIYDSVHTIDAQGLMAISSSTTKPEACADFVAMMFSSEVQTRAISSSMIPVNDHAMRTAAWYMANPEDIPEEDFCLYGPGVSFETVMTGPNPEEYEINILTLSEDVVSGYLEALYSADSVRPYDWGVQDIITEEIETGMAQGRVAEEIASVIVARLEVYAAENY